MMRLDEQADGRQIDLELNEKFEVELEQNRTTGFQWRVASSGEPVCSLINTGSQAGHSTSRDQVGQSSIQQWHFQAHAPGQGSIVLVYQRPWQQDAPPRRTLTIHVRVTA